MVIKGNAVELFVQYCQAAFSENSGIIATLFFGGLLGSLTHCAGMCGPFVIAQMGSGKGEPKGSGLVRAKGALLLPYHLGRMTTYMILGVLAASLSGFLLSAPAQRVVAMVMLSLAAVFFLGAALPNLKMKIWPPVLGKLFNVFGKAVGSVAKPFFEAPTVFHRYALGVVLGFLPCGLLAAALMAVAATADPVAGAMAMGAFCVGTMPALFLIGSGGQLALRRWPNQTATVVRGVMVFNSVSLFVIASSMVF